MAFKTDSDADHRAVATQPQKSQKCTLVNSDVLNIQCDTRASKRLQRLPRASIQSVPNPPAAKSQSIGFEKGV